MKVCTECKEEKSLNEFPTEMKRGKLIHRSKCKLCRKSQSRRRYASNPEHYREKTYRYRDPEKHRKSSEKWREKNKELHNENSKRSYHKRGADKNRDGNYRKNYGITLDDYNSMLEAQGGKCAICKRAEVQTKNGLIRPLAVDHCHTTNKVRGLLCHNCNSGIGHFSDDVERLANAIKYLNHYV